MIYSITNQKGGTGKTTTSINLACCLANEGHRTLLIDLDPQAHTTSGLGIKLDQGQLSIRDVLDREVPPEEAIVCDVTKGLDLLPSEIRLAIVAEHLYARNFREFILEKALNSVREKYDYIIVDCPPTLNVLTVNAICVADSLIIPCQTSRYSLDGMADLFNIIDTLKGKEFQNYRILLTMFDARTTVTNEIILKQLRDYQNKIFKTRISRTEALNQSQIAQESIFSFDPKSRAAKEYYNLTQEILQR
jgi:chromosome partitioning protein